MGHGYFNWGQGKTNWGRRKFKKTSVPNKRFLIGYRKICVAEDDVKRV